MESLGGGVLLAEGEVCYWGEQLGFIALITSCSVLPYFLCVDEVWPASFLPLLLCL